MLQVDGRFQWGLCLLWAYGLGFTGDISFFSGMWGRWSAIMETCE